MSLKIKVDVHIIPIEVEQLKPNASFIGQSASFAAALQPAMERVLFHSMGNDDLEPYTLYYTATPYPDSILFTYSFYLASQIKIEKEGINDAIQS